jgi:NAD(P)H-quinone oxidoreductase subunit 4
MVFEGSWTTFPWPTLVTLAASGFTAVYAIRLFNRVGFGRLDNERADWQSTRWSERAPALLLSLLVIAAGLWPTSLTGWSASESGRLALRAQPFLHSEDTTLITLPHDTAAIPASVSALLTP